VRQILRTVELAKVGSSHDAVLMLNNGVVAGITHNYSTAPHGPMCEGDRLCRFRMSTVTSTGCKGEETELGRVREDMFLTCRIFCDGRRHDGLTSTSLTPVRLGTMKACKHPKGGWG
jgi:hypothetical protein